MEEDNNMYGDIYGDCESYWFNGIDEGFEIGGVHLDDCVEGNLGEDEGQDAVDEEEERVDNDCGIGVNDLDNGVAIDDMVDIGVIDFNCISAVDIARCHFPSLEVAFLFYKWFARMRGFSVRKDKVLRTKKGEIVQQTFVCYRQGYRKRVLDVNGTRGDNAAKVKRGPKHETRTGCNARFRAHVNIIDGRWHVTDFCDLHNHELLDQQSCGMLAGHRKIDDAEVVQMNNYFKVGISTPQVYGSFANQCGGFRNLSFRIKDVYNQILRQRRAQLSDAKGAIAYLRGLSKQDPLMFWKHSTDDEGRLQNLFWCDGNSRLNYSVFGDVLAFDATYSKNKYMCPVVFFSGVNHHNHTTIFAAAFVANETEETYVWLLQRFLEAMSGKAPGSVITDGDMAMRNAIRRIFPNARHRLCAWHLLRNATSNVCIPEFTADLQGCMLGDYDIVKFNYKWKNMVAKYGLEENNWVKDLYEKRNMWATAHLRGKFFAGFRTTSRCEGFHSLIGKHIQRKNNLCQFLESFHRCLDRMRFTEEEANFASNHGDAVLRTQFVALERFASRVYTKELFDYFRKKLEKSASIMVIGCRETSSCYIYTLSKYRSQQGKWRVSFYDSSNDFKCSCMRMESYGMPCEHILRVLVYLHIGELPQCLILGRWTKDARQRIEGLVVSGSLRWDSTLLARYTALLERSKEMCHLACRTIDKFYNTLDWIMEQTATLKLDDDDDVGNHGDQNVNGGGETELLDPIRVRTKGCPSSSSRGGVRAKRTLRCGVCRGVGHNRKSCQVLRRNDTSVNENLQV